MSSPRDHHFIPVFYLKKWTGSDGKLIQYSRPCPGKFAIKKIGPRATGFHTDLYGFPDLPRELADYLEARFLARTDRLAAVVHKKLLDGTAMPWTDETRSAWARFAINFLVRHPHPFAEIRAAAYDSWLQPDSITQIEYEKIKQPTDPATLRIGSLFRVTIWQTGFAYGLSRVRWTTKLRARNSIICPGMCLTSAHRASAC
jgi:hypothetical protein